MSVATGDEQDGELRSSQRVAPVPTTVASEQYSCPAGTAVKRLLGEELHPSGGSVPLLRSGVSPASSTNLVERACLRNQGVHTLSPQNSAHDLPGCTCYRAYQTLA
jgi:hypothetical protein